MSAEYYVVHDDGRRKALTAEQGRMVRTIADEHPAGPHEATLMIEVPLSREAILILARRGILDVVT